MYYKSYKEKKNRHYSQGVGEFPVLDAINNNITFMLANGNCTAVNEELYTRRRHRGFMNTATSQTPVTPSTGN